MPRYLALLVVCLAASAAAQSFNYAGFAGATTIVRNGTAVHQNAILRVTPALPYQSGSFFHNAMVNVSQGFDTSFSFKFATPGGGGADGLALVIHNDPRGVNALGADGSEMGYGANSTSPANTAITNALVIELDTWASNINNNMDLSGNEIAVHTNGALGCTADPALAIGRVSPAINFSTNVVHYLRVVYVPGTISIYLDNGASPELVVPFDFTNGGSYVLSGGAAAPPTLAAGGMAWIGMSAGCGAAYETHDVASWSFTTLAPPTWPGNATDFDCKVSVNGVPSLDTSKVLTVNALDLIGLHFHSPGGGTDNQFFSAFYQVVTTGSLLSSAVIPGETPPGGFWLDLGGTNPGTLTGVVPFIDGIGLGGGAFLQPLLPPTGYDYGFVIPSILAGANTSLLLQALVVETGLNGLNLGIDDCIELQVM